MRFVTWSDHPLPEEIIALGYKYYSVKKIGNIEYIVPGEIDENTEYIIVII